MNLKVLTISILALTLLINLANIPQSANLIGSQKQRMREQFNEWMHQHGKSYQTTQEQLYRFDNFNQNHQYIATHNKLFEKGQFTFQLAINHFSDLTNQQFRAKYTNPNLKVTDKCTGSVKILDQVPYDEDWSPRAVNQVREQGSCAASWAFAATGALQGLYSLTKGLKVPLSPQQLIDCSSNNVYNNQGCTTGSVQNSFYYTIDNGITFESKYPYTGIQSNCSYSGDKKIFGITSCANVKANSTKALESALIQQPVAVMVQTGSLQFQFYKRGIFNGNCGTKVDSFMLLTGYGALDEKNFWKCKNSWGIKWGDEGYIFLHRDKAEQNMPGKCGILLQPSVPLTE